MGYQERHPGVSRENAEEAVREIQGMMSDRAHSTWKNIDAAFLQPLFGGRRSPFPQESSSGELYPAASPGDRPNGLNGLQTELTSHEGDYLPP